MFATQILITKGNNLLRRTETLRMQAARKRPREEQGAGKDMPTAVNSDNNIGAYFCAPLSVLAMTGKEAEGQYLINRARKSFSVSSAMCELRSTRLRSFLRETEMERMRKIARK